VFLKYLIKILEFLLAAVQDLGAWLIYFIAMVFYEQKIRKKNLINLHLLRKQLNS